jgi:ATP-dependent Lon protease
VIAPDRNEPDVEDFPAALLEDVEFIWVPEVEDVLEAALEVRNRGPRPAGMLASSTS